MNADTDNRDLTLEQHADFMALRQTNPAFCWGVIANLPGVDAEDAARVMGVSAGEAVEHMRAARVPKQPGRHSAFAVRVSQGRARR